MATEKELNRIAEQTGLSVSEIKAGIAKIQAEQGLAEQGALAVYKSSIKNLLGGKVAEVSGRVLWVEGLRNAKLRDREVQVSSAHLFLKEDGRYLLRRLSLWEDNAALSKDLRENQVVSFKAKLMDDGMGVRLIGGEITPTNEVFPSIRELVSAAGITPMSNIKEHLDGYCFVKGYVGRTFDSTFGKGIEISDEGGNPVTVWLEGEPAVSLGSEVVCFGYVNEKDGAVRIRGRIVY
jgi:hypothetical protein